MSFLFSGFPMPSLSLSVLHVNMELLRSQMCSTPFIQLFCLQLLLYLQFPWQWPFSSKEMVWDFCDVRRAIVSSQCSNTNPSWNVCWRHLAQETMGMLDHYCYWLYSYPQYPSPLHFRLFLLLLLTLLLFISIQTPWPNWTFPWLACIDSWCHHLLPSVCH